MAAPSYNLFSGAASGNAFQDDQVFLASFADASILGKVVAIKRLNSRFAISNKTWFDFQGGTATVINDFGYGPSGHANADVRKYSKTAQHWDPTAGGGGTISNIKLESTALDSIYIGSTAVSKVYVGSTQVWGTAGAGSYVTQTIFFEGYQVTVTAPGNSAYVIDGWDKNGPISSVNNKNIAMSVGSIIKFNLDCTGHPFWIKTVQGNGTGNQYQNTDYISNNNGKISGYTVFSPPSTGTWYYNCENHTAMTGTIVVS